MCRMRSLGCSPCTGAVRSTPTRCRRSSRSWSRPAVRASAARHRPRSGRVDGDEEARRLLLMPDLLLRICTAGSVDDGKSTLIGRLLYDSRSVYEDQVQSVGRRRRTGPPGRSTSRCSPTACAPSASRASRSTSPTDTSRPRAASSSSPTRRATSSTPATWRPARRPPTSPSCWSTRGTASASSRGGTRGSRGCSASPTSSWPSTRWIWSDFDRDVFEDIVDEFDEHPGGTPACTRFRSARWTATTSSRTSDRTPWFDGPSLLEFLETVRGRRDADAAGRSAFRCSWWCGPIRDFRGYAGQIALRLVRVGDTVTVWPADRATPRQADRDVGRRPRTGVRADVGHADAGRRNGHQPRGRADQRMRRKWASGSMPTSSGWTSGRSTRRASTC